MSIPAASFVTENKNSSEMSATEYVHSRSSTYHPDNQFRWATSTDRSPYNQYYQDKQVNPLVLTPKIDFNRYPDIRHSYEPRTRMDENITTEEHQKLHELHSQQCQRNVTTTTATKNDGPSSLDPRFLMNDSRTVLVKKGLQETHDVRPVFMNTASNLNNSLVSKSAAHAAAEIRYAPYPHLSSMLIKLGTDIRLPIQNHLSEPPPATILTTVPQTNTTTTQTSHLVEQVDLLPKSLPNKPNISGNQRNIKKEHLIDEKKKSNEYYVNSSKLNTVKTTEPECTSSDESSKKDKQSPKEEGSAAPDNSLPSYTAMIAQAILRKEHNKSTLSDIYEYMEKYFPSLEKRGTGWRNCVRHTLSLNDCFIKLHRPENGRSCNWAVHPSYFESFSRGDYRKRRALRKRPRGLQWIDPMMLGAYPFVREHEMHTDGEHQVSPFYHYPPPGVWTSSQQGYLNTSQPSPNHLQHFSQSHPPPPHSSLPPAYTSHTTQHGHVQNAHCINPDCYCQFNKNNYRPGFTP